MLGTASVGALVGASVGKFAGPITISVLAGVGETVVAGAAQAASKVTIRGKTKRIRFIISPVPNFDRKGTL